VSQLEAVVHFLEDLDGRLEHRYRDPIGRSLSKYRDRLRAARGETSPAAVPADSARP
jgi:hypothetical protein